MTMKIHPASWSPKIPAGHVNTNSDTTAIAIIGAGVGGISASMPNRTTAWAATVSDSQSATSSVRFMISSLPQRRAHWQPPASSAQRSDSVGATTPHFEPLVENARPGSARPRVTPTTAHPARTGIDRTVRSKERSRAQEQCRPTAGACSEVGDDALAYEACDRRIDYRAELTKLKYVSIVNAYEARRGAVAGQRFRTALIAAWAAATERRETT